MLRQRVALSIEGMRWSHHVFNGAIDLDLERVRYGKVDPDVQVSEEKRNQRYDRFLGRLTWFKNEE